MPEAPHQLGEGGTCRSSQYRAGVPEIVPSKIRTTCGRAGAVEEFVQSDGWKMRASRGREQKSITSWRTVSREMVEHGRPEVRRDGDIADTGI